MGSDDYNEEWEVEEDRNKTWNTKSQIDPDKS